ncbi:uncharacterized protein [Elaeis guineensis]|uniref:Protein KAKU4 isoform X2 n=1 Tax=Elaeis guineensis var. tenera TaxID=51953 RepID=A0A6I9QS09_ELAGV|nr:protein KAKU4 isoform X2 [Elaeis guineensis]
MASIFRARCQREGGAGGKILRGRPAAPPASPYARPKKQLPSPASASLASSQSPRWIQGLISGAGKLISTVFRSEDSSCSSSSGYSSDGEISLSSDDKEDVDASSKHLHRLNQGGNRPNSARDCMEGSQAVVSRSESKLVIEQLLMQETFTRDECNRLTKIIQSRVIEAPFTGVVEGGTHKGTSDRATSSATAFLGAWQSLNQNLLESIQYSASKLNAFSPGYSAIQACTPDLRDTAVMEAKKWLEEKRLASSSKHTFDCGPCTLNTDRLQYGIENESGSPLDLAKTYMRSLPPWKSPSLSSIGFKTPPPSWMHLYKDESTDATLNHFLSSSKVLKRNSLSIGLWDTLEETRRVRLKSRDETLEIPKFKQIDSSARLFENDTSKISLGADMRDQKVLGVDHHSNSLGPTDVPSASPKLPEELNTENLCSNGALGFSDQKDGEENTLTETGNVTSIDIVSEPEEALNAVQPTNKSSLPHTNSSHPVRSIIESELKSSSHNVLVLENNKEDGTERLQLQDGSIDVPHESLILASKSVELGGNLLSEANDLTSQCIKIAVPSGADGAINGENNHTSSIQTVPEVLGILEANDSSQLNLDPGLKKTHSIADSRLPDGNPRMQKEANGSAQKITATGSAAESNANSDLESSSKGDPCGTNSNGEPATASISEGIHEPQNECAINIPSGHDTNSTAGKSRNGTRMKSIERMLTKPQPSMRLRRRKAVAKTKRGRGAK